jgi:hypothetical protein
LASRRSDAATQLPGTRSKVSGCFDFYVDSLANRAGFFATDHHKAVGIAALLRRAQSREDMVRDFTTLVAERKEIRIFTVILLPKKIAAAHWQAPT